MVPIEIGAQILRQPAACADAIGKIAILANDPAKDAATRKSRTRTPWKQADVKRAIAAAEQAGLGSYRVEISPDGTISIIVGAPADTAAEADPYVDLGRP